MKRSPAIGTERHEFSRMPSLPWRKLPSRNSTPWIGFDPELQSDCSAAYRAFRLVVLALFALIGASSRAQTQSSPQSDPGSISARIEAQERQIAELKALVLQQARQLESQQQIVNKLQREQRSGTRAIALPTQSAAEDKRESAHLKVNRTHAPPPSNSPSADLISGSPEPQSGPALCGQPNDPNRTSSAAANLERPTLQQHTETESSSQTIKASVPSASQISNAFAPPAPATEPSAMPDSPLQFRIGSTYLTPFGFLDFTSIWRNHDTGDGIATSFASIPYGRNTVATNLSELRFSSQYSRIGFRVDALVKGARLTGYMESDFLGSVPGNVAVSTNSNTLRMRLYWADLRKSWWEVLFGQTWSLITPNRAGISPIPGDIFYSQNIDADYQAGLVWARVPELRFVYHPNRKLALAVALDSPEQYMGGSAGGGKITLPADLAPIYDGGELNNGSSGLHTPNLAPDVILKLALDPSKRFHFEVGGMERQFRLYNPITSRHFSATGGGGFVNLGYELTKGLRLLTNNFWSDGGGRYILGQVPDLIVRADGSPSLIHAGSTVTGAEYTCNRNLLYGYYGAIYAQRNVAADLDGTPIGYGYNGAPTTQNRTIQEATLGFNRTLWKEAKYGSLKFLSQYSYLTRSPWFIDTGQPPNANVHMLFLTLRYSLPGSAPAFVQ